MAKQNTGNVGGMTSAEIKAIREEAIALQNTIGSIGEQLNSNLQILGQTVGENTKGFQEGFNASKLLANAISAVDSKTLESKKQQVAFQDKVRRAQEEATRLEAKANRFRQEATVLGKKQAVEALKIARAYDDAADSLQRQAQSAGKIVDEFEQLNKQVKVFDDISDFFKEIPGVSKVFGEFQRASDAARESASRGGNSFVAGAKQLTGALVKGAAAYGITTMVKGIANADERIVSLSRNLNRSRQESIGLVKNFNEVARSTSGLSGTDLQTAAEGFSEAMGTSAVVSAQTATTLATQTKFLGLSVDQANKLNAFSEATGTNIKDDTEQIAGQVIVSNARNKTSIKYQAIMKDIAGTSNAAKLLITGQGKSLTAAAIEAKKLGTTMEGIANIGKSMLDFESSIGNELEAELLTGGEINNERARALALMGDTEGLAKEVAKSGVLAKFEGSKNVLQQEALAKAYGMSKEEMANMVVESKALASLGAKDKSDLSIKLKDELARVNAITNATDREAARAALIKKTGSEEIIRQQETLTIADQQALANQRIVEAMDMLIPIIKPISDTFKFIADHAKAFAVALAVITGGSMLSKLSNLTGMFGKLSGGTGGAASVAEDLAGSTGGGGGKGFLGKMGAKFAGGKGGAMLGKASKFLGKGVLGGAGIGALLSGISNVSEYGWTGEALGRTALSGVGTLLGGAAGTALLPGAGTVGGSMAGSMAGDALGDLIFGEKPDTAEDFIMRPGQKPLKFRKDDIIMGGTSLAGNSGGGDSGEVVSLLRELIAATKQGKPVHLDGQKVNSVLGQNLYTVGG
jgi:hypothetical protein